MPLRPGKVPWELISDSLQTTFPPEVLLGPACGEDAAAVKIGDETWVVASDPITFSAPQAGRLSVIVNANDIAVRGATPRFFVPVVLLSSAEASEDRVEALLGQIRHECDRIGVAVIGGHTEVTDAIDHSIVVGTMMGKVGARLITTGGIEVGDRIGLVRWAGLEGTSILCTDLSVQLRQHGLIEIGDGLESLLSGEWLSVLQAALAMCEIDGVRALHDVTEGGVGEALYEVSVASGLDLDVDLDSVPVLDQTRRLCEVFGIDPLGLIGSGALLVGCADAACAEVERCLLELDLPLRWIGRAVEPGRSATRLPRFPRDELLHVFAMQDVEAVLFDMDGTLIRSTYDWPAIRAALGVTQDSIIDELNGLSEPDRTMKWSELERVERSASEAAGMIDGARELMAEVVAAGLKIALVTNNSQANTDLLIDRFDLSFDVVLTRDSGLWKPSGAVLVEAARRLGTSVDRCMAVGDSRYDLAAGREAECRLVCMVCDGEGTYKEQADLSFADLPSLTRALQIVRGS
ncbi:MAG: HAD-IA family hydrolase [bacterium]|nr:HAD-IA family hydrolase [bacterium]